MRAGKASAPGAETFRRPFIEELGALAKNELFIINELINKSLRALTPADDLIELCVYSMSTASKACQQLVKHVSS